MSGIILQGACLELEGLSWRSSTALQLGRMVKGIDIELNDATVSLRHARVFQSKNEWYIEDLGSKTGTFINNIHLPAGKQLPLQEQDIIQLGRMKFTVSFEHEEQVNDTLPAMPETVHSDEKDIRTTRGVMTVQATSQQSWDEAIEVVTPPSGQGAWKPEHIRALLRAGHAVSRVASLNEMLQDVLKDLMSVLHAQRASILLEDPDTGNLRLRKFLAIRPQLEEQSHSRTITARCFEKEESVLCADVQKEQAILSAQSVSAGSMSSVICALLRTPRKKLGVVHLDRGPLQVPFTREEFHLADAIASTLSVGIESALLVEAQKEAFVQTVAALGRTVEIRDAYTANHTTRVTEYSLLLARSLNISESDMELIRVGAPLHDIGKVGVPDAILNKAGPLNHQEREVMKTHAAKGAAILETIPTLRHLAKIARHHHERWDGKGYPDGLAGDNISLVARIVSVADVFDALTSDRPYRQALPLEVAFQEISRGIATHFDPKCVATFLQLKEQVLKVQRRHQKQDTAIINLQTLLQS